MKLVSAIKNLVVPAGRAPRTIAAGPFKGIRMNLDLRTQSQIYLGLFERELYPWLTRLTADVRSVVDIGAAFGEYTLFFLLKTKAERVISFEPNPEMFEPLQENLRLNGAESDPRWEWYRKYLGGAAGQDSMPASALVSRILAPCLVKMDIDGGEMNVLRGVPELLAAPGVQWLIETHSLELEQQCIAILSAAGYSTEIISQAWWRTVVPEQRPSIHNRWLVATK